MQADAVTAFKQANELKLRAVEWKNTGPGPKYEPLRPLGKLLLQAFTIVKTHDAGEAMLKLVELLGPKHPYANRFRMIYQV